MTGTEEEWCQRRGWRLCDDEREDRDATNEEEEVSHHRAFDPPNSFKHVCEKTKICHVSRTASNLILLCFNLFFGKNK